MRTTVTPAFVRHVRKDLCGLTQDAFATTIGLAQRTGRFTVNRWENGSSTCSGTHAVLIRLLFDDPDLVETLGGYNETREV